MPMPPPELKNRALTAMELHLRAESLDEEKRSVEAVIATDRPVRVFDMQRWDVIDEVLVADGGVFPRQVPLLDNHNRNSMDDQIGSVTGFRTEDGQWVARLSYADDGDKADRTYKKVKQGHARDVSLGYEVLKAEDIPAGKSKKINGREWSAGDVPLRISTAWRGREVSSTPIGADAMAQIRKAALGNVPSNTGAKNHEQATIGLLTKTWAAQRCQRG